MWHEAKYDQRDFVSTSVVYKPLQEVGDNGHQDMCGPQKRINTIYYFKGRWSCGDSFILNEAVWFTEAASPS